MPIAARGWRRRTPGHHRDLPDGLDVAGEPRRSRGIQDRVDRELHVLGGHRTAVVEHGIGSQRERPGGRIVLLPALRDTGHDVATPIGTHEAVEQGQVHVGREGAGVQQWIEVLRVGGLADHEDRGLVIRLRAGIRRSAPGQKADGGEKREPARDKAAVQWCGSLYGHVFLSLPADASLGSWECESGSPANADLPGCQRRQQDDRVRLCRDCNHPVQVPQDE